ncbi:hypothetical protein [uncultured Methanobrevibacter sp.]|uniref:hypothetical protein n=1 Tax=uncultured Methanobrevibacter sp. TaxID=253161 RepID=UPI0025F802C1|nr:hypothetical protein [uncultured Methanobrevibacter sp.]
MKRKFLILLCLIVFIVSITAVSAADDSNKTICDNTLTISQNNGGISDSMGVSPLNDLQEKIDGAEEGSEISFDDDYKYSFVSLFINKSITINGNGHILDANQSDRILYIESDNVVLKNISFINGFYRDGNGGAIAINGNNTIIFDCIFRGNGLFSSFGGIKGGAIFCDGDLTVINSIFENNGNEGIDSVSSSGGAIFCDGDLTVINSSFISNQISSSGGSLSGGAIASTCGVDISDSNFTGNSISGQFVCGGAVSANAVNVNNSIFSDNYVESSVSWFSNTTSSAGGAIYCERANIYNSDFVNNSALIIDGHQFSNGGAMYSIGITNIGNSNFINNSADDGEAIWAYLEYANIDNCTFINNDYSLVKISIDAPVLVKYCGGPERFVVHLTDRGKAIANVDVNININGMDYFRATDENGIASIAINLNSGQYNVIVKYINLIVNSSITVKPTVFGNNITKIFRNGTQYYAYFIDTMGNPLAYNTAVEFNINGIFYERYIDENGGARMNINLNPGEYVITAKNPNSGERYANIITVLPSIVENYDLIKYYKNESKFTFKLLDDQGSSVGEGVSATININGVLYNRQTNSSGYVNMNINLNPGTYIATIQYNGLMRSNTIEVLSILSASDLGMTYMDGSKFEVGLVDGQGKAFANQNVTFNINGVFYYRTTDDNGIARLNINLMKGEYIITSSYNGCDIANKITIV